jgi:FdhD protein
MPHRFVTRVERDAGPTRPAPVRTVRGASLELRNDDVVVEEPLEIRVSRQGDAGPGKAVSVTMRTPGHDVELALGFLHGEGVVRSLRDVTSVRQCGPDGNVVSVELSAGLVVDHDRLQRNFYATSSCGVCGKATLAAVEAMMPAGPVDARISVSAGLLRPLAAAARAAQPIFLDTGGLHAATLFDEHGALVAAHEDVGRHNALDKLVGARLLEDALPLWSSILLLSGRASFEMLQKAAVAGIPVVAAIGAPSSLAIDVAERTGILLVGFLRGDSFNVYAHGERLQ